MRSTWRYNDYYGVKSDLVKLTPHSRLVYSTVLPYRLTTLGTSSSSHRMQAVTVYASMPVFIHVTVQMEKYAKVPGLTAYLTCVHCDPLQDVVLSTKRPGLHQFFCTMRYHAESYLCYGLGTVSRLPWKLTRRLVRSNCGLELQCLAIRLAGISRIYRPRSPRATDLLAY